MIRPRPPLEANRAGQPPGLDAATNAILATGAVLVVGLGALVGLGIAFREPAALPVLLLGGGLAVLLLSRPEWIVPTFVGITWAALPGHVFGGLPSPVEVGGLVLLAFAAWRMLEQPKLAANVVVIASLLLLPLVASSVLSPEGGSVPIADMREVLFLVIVALAVFGPYGVERVALALVVVALFLGLGGIFSVLIGPTDIFPVVADPEFFVDREAPRAGGPFGEPNFYALSLAALTPLALFVVGQGGWRRSLGLLVLVAIAGGIMAAGSRGAAIAMLFALVAFAGTTPNRQLRLAALATVLVAAALVPLFASQAGSSATRSVGGRATENLIAAAMVEDHPLVGVGPGTYEALYRDYSRDIGNDPRPSREPHSLPLEIAAEQGIAGVLGWGLAATIVLSYSLSRGVWRTALGRALVLSTATYLVGSLFLHGSQLRLLFMLVGLVLAYATYLHEAKLESDRAGLA